MSKDRELTIDELDVVSGGADTCKTTAVCFNFTPFQPGGGGGNWDGGGDAGAAVGAWNTLLGQYGLT
jgi:hypothetical protein